MGVCERVCICVLERVCVRESVYVCMKERVRVCECKRVCVSHKIESMYVNEPFTHTCPHVMV